MTTSALAMMIGWMGFVTIMAGYFFYRVLTVNRKNEEETDDGNDNQTEPNQKQ